MRRGAKFYFAANLTAQVSALLRYVILARLLGPVEFGLAATLILTAAFFESVSDTGADRFLIQDKDGDRPRMQGVVHAIMLARGILIASALLMAAGAISGIYRTPDLESSVMALAIAPLITGFAHLDLRRSQRHGDFRPESWSMSISEPVSLAATAIAAWYLRDHTAVIYGLVARAAVVVAVSHITAARRYGLSWRWSEARQFGAFAAPLAANGVLLFFGAQGDRVIISGLGPETLGYYSAVLMLIYYPSAMLGRFMVGLHLPELSRVKSKVRDFNDMQHVFSTRVILIGLAMLFGYSLLGPILTPIVYGPKFNQPLLVFALLSALQCVRFIRIWPTTMSLSLGQSRHVLISNLARLSAIPAAVLLVSIGGSLEVIILSFLAGEALAVFTAMALLSRARMLNSWREGTRAMAFVAVASGICATSFLHQLDALPWALACAVATLAVLVASFWFDHSFIAADLMRLRVRLLRARGR